MRLLALLVVSVAAVGLGASPAWAAPVWRIRAVANSTVAAGGEVPFIIEAMNLGDAVTDGSPITFVARLPPGLSAVNAYVFDKGAFANASPSQFPCTAGDGVSPVAGATVVRCVTNQIVSNLNLAVGFQLLSLTARADPGARGTLTSSFSVAGGGGAEADTVDPVVVGPPRPFGIATFDGLVADQNGQPLTQAGAHPASASVFVDFNAITSSDPLAGEIFPAGSLKDVSVDLPAGFAGSQAAAAECTSAELANSNGMASQPLCPPESQVGVTEIRTNGLAATQPLAYGPIPVFNMVPPANVPARFGFNFIGTVVVLDAKVRSDGDYGISVDSKHLPEPLPTLGTTFTFWGVPSSPVHTPDRACPGDLAPAYGGATCASGDAGNPVPFLRNPTSCTPAGQGLTTTMNVDSWEGASAAARFTTHLLPGYPAAPEDWGAQVGTTGCENVPFDPGVAGSPAVGTPDTPSAFSFDVTLPQSQDPNAIGEGDLRAATVSLPADVHVNPASAKGLAACTQAQIGLGSESDATCPDASKIGTVTVQSPLLRTPLSGAVYLAAPHDNPFGTLLALYLVVRGQGVVVKLAGRVDADPATGQLSTTFDDNPQLPFSDLHLAFFGGDHTPLVTPRQCGTYTTSAMFTSWSGKTVPATGSFTISGDGHGGPCSPDRFSPTVTGGSTHPVAAADTDFGLQVARSDADEDMSGLTVHMPPGLTAHIVNVPLCPEPQATQGTCGETSRVGDVTVGAGAGPDPFYITTGRAYLTGPYKGAPFGLSIVVPAVAGPFDLGNVIVRAAVQVDKHTAAVSVASDPLPTILQGIPLDVRDIRVTIDRPHFFLNPTNCSALQIGADLGSTNGMSARPTSRFQVDGCKKLAFKPRMVLGIGGRGHTRFGQPTPLTTTLTMPRGDANLKSVRVVLPTTLSARLNVITDACTRAQFETDIAVCQHAKAGTATAVTPLLRSPLRGGVYFVKGRPGLPDLIVALRGQVAFDLIGRISIPGGTRLATTFNAAPDVPIRSFSLRLFGGSSNASIAAVANLCTAKSRRAAVQLSYVAQNGRTLNVAQRLRVGGCPKAKPKPKPHRRRR